MPDDRTPHEGQVWTDPMDGQPMLFVRLDQRPGRDERRLLFLKTRDGIVYERRLPEGAMPEEYELKADPDAMRRAQKAKEDLVYERIQWQLRERELEAETKALVAAMKRAVATVSPTTAADLRRVYRETKGSVLGAE